MSEQSTKVEEKVVNVDSFRSFRKIGQFHNLVSAASRYKWNKPIKFLGTVKLHGTNAGVRMNSDGSLRAQSRRRDITVDKDNCGFAEFVEANKDFFSSALAPGCVVYGEWCGKGVQKTTAISQLSRRLFLFAGKDNNNNWMTPKEISSFACAERSIFSIFDYPTFELEINLGSKDTAKASSARLSKITQEIDARCPVAASFGVDGCGEGVVWSGTVTNSENGLCTRLMFKTKGEKHQIVQSQGNKQRTPAEIGAAMSHQEFAEMVVTKARVEQAITETGATSTKQTKDVINWILRDVIAEESSLLPPVVSDYLLKKYVSKRTAMMFKVMMVGNA